MATGIIKRYFGGQRFGFISRDDGQADCFFHLNNVEAKQDQIKEGRRVSFDEATDLKNGKLHATNVAVLPS